MLSIHIYQHVINTCTFYIHLFVEANESQATLVNNDGNAAVA